MCINARVKLDANDQSLAQITSTTNDYEFSQF